MCLIFKVVYAACIYGPVFLRWIKLVNLDTLRSSGVLCDLNAVISLVYKLTYILVLVGLDL